MQTDKITIVVERKKKRALLKLLKSMDVEIQTAETVIKKFIRSAPKNVPLTDEDIVRELKAARQKRA